MTFIVSSNLIGVFLFCLLGVWTQNLSFLGGQKHSGNTQLTFIDVAFSVKTFWPFIMIGSCHKCRNGICVCECDIFLFVWFGLCGVSSSAVRKKKKEKEATCHRSPRNMNLSQGAPCVFFASQTLFCTQQYQEQQLTYRAFMGGFSRTSFVYVGFCCFLHLLRMTLVGFGERLSVLSSLICGCGGKFSFGIWAHAAWKPRSQHFISEWGQLCHTSHNGCTHIHKHPLTQTHTRTHTHWHSLVLPGQSEWSVVGPPRSGWESCWSRSLSQDTQSFYVARLENFSDYYLSAIIFL